MQRQCPNCHGHKVLFPNQFSILGHRMTLTCTTCDGTGVVHGKHPGRRGHRQRKVKRTKTPSYIKARREKN